MRGTGQDGGRQHGEPRPRRRRLVRIAAAAGLTGGVVSATVGSASIAEAAVTVHVPCSPTVAGGGPAGLIAAISTANARGGGTIDLARGCTYTLGPNADNDTNGLPIARRPITINGNGSTVARSQAPGTVDFRIFEVDGPGKLTLDRVTTTGGRSSEGGGILVDHGGTLTLTHSRVDHNAVIAPGTKGFGGGISNNNRSTLTLNSSRLDDNSVGDAALAGGGGLHEDNDSRSTVNSTRVDHNSVQASAVAVGGGIALNFGSGARTMALHNSQVEDNVVTATDSGPMVLARGGGIEHNGTTLTLSGSRVTGNTATAVGGAAFGGGIHMLSTQNGQPFPGGHLTLTNSRVTGNTASGSRAGGGGTSSELGATKTTSIQVTSNTVRASGSEGSDGAGIENLKRPEPTVPAPTLSMTTSQVHGNTLTASGAPACGGGLFNSGSVSAERSIITGNTATGTPAQGGGVFNAKDLSLVQSIVSGNVPDNRFDGTAASCRR